MKFRKCLGQVVLLISLCIPLEQVFATTVTNDYLGIEMKFPENYAVLRDNGTERVNKKSCSIQSNPIDIPASGTRLTIFK